MTRKVTANIMLSLDGRVNGAGGDYDMSWIVPHAITEASRDHMIRVTQPATTAVLGRKNYEGFGGFWPAVADDENATDALGTSSTYRSPPATKSMVESSHRTVKSAGCGP